MNKSTKTRYAIFQILAEVHKKNKSFEIAFNNIVNKHNFNKTETSFINNVCLNTMRKSIHSKLILKKIIKSKLKVNEFLLLASAITQLIYLNLKPYAVVNETVNVAKKVKIFPGFINAVLKNITKNIDYFQETQISVNDFPKWFIEEANITKNINLNSFIENFDEQPSLHLVFKSEEYLKNFTEPHLKSSKKSAFLKVYKKINNIKNYEKGEWWVQDFSSMIPLAINNKIKKLNILDFCAAPGGKAFQILNNNKVILNDISHKRILKLKENLSRLRLNPEIKNLNALDFVEKHKFDIVLVDSPCSSIGTIRRHPEIFFKQKKPDFKNLNQLQKNLIQKASKLLKKRGKIIYMVCSFLHSETIEVVNNFLEKNKNFSIEKYSLNAEFIEIKKLISKEGYFLTMPTKHKIHNIDGFFAAQLIKND